MCWTVVSLGYQAVSCLWSHFDAVLPQVCYLTTAVEQNKYEPQPAMCPLLVCTAGMNMLAGLLEAGGKRQGKTG